MTDKLAYPYLVRTEYVPDLVARPFLPVRIRYRQLEIQTMALLDSGSDINVLPYKLGLDLGADWDSREDIEGLEGIGGGLIAKRFVADLYIETWPSIRQIFAWARDDDIPVILGQVDFFQNYFEVDMSAE